MSNRQHKKQEKEHFSVSISWNCHPDDYGTLENELGKIAKKYGGKEAGAGTCFFDNTRDMSFYDFASKAKADGCANALRNHTKEVGRKKIQISVDKDED